MLDIDKKQFWTIVFALLAVLVILYIWHMIETNYMFGGNSCPNTVPGNAVQGSISCQAFQALTAAQQQGYTMSQYGNYYVPTGSNG